MQNTEEVQKSPPIDVLSMNGHAVGGDGLHDNAVEFGGTTNEFTDLKNGEMLARMHGRDIQCVGGKRWYVWDGTRYRYDETDEITRRAKATVQAMLKMAANMPATTEVQEAEKKRYILHAVDSQSAHRIRNMIAMASSEENISARSSSFDADPYVLNLLNGTLDLRTFEVRPHRRRDRITKIAPTEYHGRVVSARWNEFVAGLFPDPAVREFVQTAVGYSLLGNPREDCMFFLYGPPRTGKTTFLEAIRQTLGDYASTFKFELLLASDLERSSGNATPDLMSLEGRRFITATETKQGRRLDEGKVKWITGMDTIRGRALYENEREFAPTHTLWIAANDAPRAKSDDAGLWTRVHRIPAGVQPRLDPDPRIREGILDGSCDDAVLSWALDGLRRYQRERLVVPDGITRSTRAWRSESDPLEDAFDEVFETGVDATCTPQAAWDAYDQWARYNADAKDRIKSKRSLGKRLADRGFERVHDGSHGREPWIGFKPRGQTY
jgi:putative DNA primase/helicase